MVHSVRTSEHPGSPGTANPVPGLRLRDYRLQHAAEEHAFAAYRDALAAGASALHAVPIVVPLPPEERGAGVAAPSLRWFEDIADEDGLAFVCKRREVDALALMHGTRGAVALLEAVEHAMALWRTCESLDDPGVLGPVIGWEPLDPALCRGVLPSLYRLRWWRAARSRGAFDATDLRRLSAASHLALCDRTFSCPVDLADVLRDRLVAAGGERVLDAAWTRDRSPPRFSFHTEIGGGDLMVVAVTPGDPAWELRRAGVEITWLVVPP